MKAKVIVKDQSSLYGYYQRENSYTNTYSKTKNDNYIEVYKDRYNYLQNKIEKDLLDKHYLFCVYSAYLMISKSHLKELLNDKNMQVEYKYFRQKFSIDSKLSLKRKILYILLFLNKQIFYFVISRCFK